MLDITNKLQFNWLFKFTTKACWVEKKKKAIYRDVNGWKIYDWSELTFNLTQTLIKKISEKRHVVLRYLAWWLYSWWIHTVESLLFLGGQC